MCPDKELALLHRHVWLLRTPRNSDDYAYSIFRHWNRLNIEVRNGGNVAPNGLDNLLIEAGRLRDAVGLNRDAILLLDPEHQRASTLTIGECRNGPNSLVLLKEALVFDKESLRDLVLNEPVDITLREIAQICREGPIAQWRHLPTVVLSVMPSRALGRSSGPAGDSTLSGPRRSYVAGKLRFRPKGGRG
jgi:hypothetical protein